MTPSWLSQKVPPMGAIKAEGIKNQLGRPDMDRFTVLVREAAQNSWDAADPDRQIPVHFGLDLCELDDGTADAWRRIVPDGAPSPEQLGLRDVLQAPTLTILFVSDRGTEGLGGPTRADEARDGEAHDYVSFVLNVGDPRDTELGGGTYGFGKAVFFLASAASTILVYTRCRDALGGVESRLVGCALGAGYELEGRGYTGRHWFGLPGDGEELVEPVRGDAADALAEELGFPRFEAGALGTTIAIVAPELDGDDPDEITSRLANSILWHLWPKMVAPETGDPAMSFVVARDGIPVDIPDPGGHPVLREFVAALKELEVVGDLITHGVGSQPVGRINLRTTFAPIPRVDDVGIEAGLGAGIHHCCLLRAPELVVEYRRGPALPDEHVWYAGVFKVFEDQDQRFAQAEPPTHDSWSPEYLEAKSRSVVRVTLRKVDEKLKSHAAPKTTTTDRGGGDGFAAVSRMLGGLIAPAPGQAAGPTTRGAAGAGTRSLLKMLGSPEWARYEGRDVLIQRFEVNARRQVTVDADTSVRVWGGGGKETELPAGAETPTLIGWRGPDGAVHPSGRLAIGPDESGNWEAIVRSPPDTVTRIRIHEALFGQSDDA
jgi:hypothetical protein